MTDIIEIISMRRSGHHAVMSWLIQNLTGLKVQGWDYRLMFMGDSNFAILNEANQWQKNAEILIKNHQIPPSTLMTNYEDAKSDFTIFDINQKFMGTLNLKPIWGIEPKSIKRILVLRNFYNVISSRYKANKSGLYSHSFDTTFIEQWKEHARQVVNNNICYINFEEWLTSKENRNQFLIENFGIKERFGVDNIKGTISSFNEHKNVLERYKMVDLPDEIKKLIREDSELNYLIGRLNYEHVKF